MSTFWRSASRSTTGNFTLLERSRFSAITSRMRRRSLLRLASMANDCMTASSATAPVPCTCRERRPAERESLLVVKLRSVRTSSENVTSAVSPRSPASRSAKRMPLAPSLSRMAAELAAVCTGLANQSVVVVVWADRGIRIDNPNLQLDLATGLEQKLKMAQTDEKPKELIGATFPVRADSVARFQEDHPEMEYEPIEQTALKFNSMFKA